MPTETPRLRVLFRGQVSTDGVLIIREQSRWRGWLARHHNREVTVSLEPEYRARSTQSNRYLWAVVYGALAEWSGHEPEEIHEAMKAKFLSRRVLTMPDGSTVEVVGSTAVLDSKAFGEYVDQVIRYAAECGVYVPAPGEIVEVA